MNIEKKLISMNYTKGVVIKSKYIVIHETANTSKGANALAHFNYWDKNADANSSAHFVVDDKQIIQLGEFENGKCFKMWHVGDNKGKSDISNDNSIGIEICVNSDGDYMRARQNAIELTRLIIEKTSLTVAAVKRHYDAWGKHCPATMLDKPELWTDFIKQLEQKSESTPPNTASTIKFDLFGQKTVSINGSIINGVSLIEARQLLEAMEFLVIWNDAIKTIEVRAKSSLSYNNEEITVLQKIVQAEAGGEDRKGKVLVANVIFNRVKAKNYPNTIKDVVFAPNQFEPTRNGAYEKAVPSQETVIAIQEALCGVDYSQGALFFRATNGLTPDCWHEKALKPLFVHGGHKFYC